MRSILFLGLALCCGTPLFGQAGSAAVLAGDCNRDGMVDKLDVPAFVRIIESGTYREEADCNGDGAMNLLDIDPFIAILSGEPRSQTKCLTGDINQDGMVNLFDVDPFIKMLASGEYHCVADINGDGIVNLLDANLFVDAVINALIGFN